MNIGRRRPKQLVVDVPNLAADLPPVEIRQNRGLRIRAQLGRDFRIIQESDNSAAERFVVAIRYDERVVPLAPAPRETVGLPASM